MSKTGDTPVEEMRGKRARTGESVHAVYRKNVSEHEMHLYIWELVKYKERQQRMRKQRRSAGVWKSEFERNLQRKSPIDCRTNMRTV